MDNIFSIKTITYYLIFKKLTLYKKVLQDNKFNFKKENKKYAKY